MKISWLVFAFTLTFNCCVTLSLNCNNTNSPTFILDKCHFKHYIDQFNDLDRNYGQDLEKSTFLNANSFDFLSENIPFFECPDKEIERTYYFRWWSYRKHIKAIPSSSSKASSFYVITEFIDNVPWAGTYNTISCAAAHHIREGRWLHNHQIITDYIQFWLREGNLRQYSFWIANSLLAFIRVTGDAKLFNDKSMITYQSLVSNFKILRKTNYNNEVGLYFNTDNRDGMEGSIGGYESKMDRAYRPTLNSYQYGESKALATLAEYVNRTTDYTFFMQCAESLKRNILTKLWDSSAQFFKVLPVPRKGPESNMSLVSWRELHGYSPWYFDLITSTPSSSSSSSQLSSSIMTTTSNIDTTKHASRTGTVISSISASSSSSSSSSLSSSSMINYNCAWNQVMDPQGFMAPHGLTTAEQRHTRFKVDYTNNHECLWDGPVWPYATAVTLTALANALHSYKQSSQQNKNNKNNKRKRNKRRNQFIAISSSCSSSSSAAAIAAASSTTAASSTAAAVSAVERLSSKRSQRISKSLPVTKANYMHLLQTYAYSHKLSIKHSNMATTTTAAAAAAAANIMTKMSSIPWIDENLDPYTGEWISRKILHSWYDKGKGKGKGKGKEANRSDDSIEKKLREKGGKNRGRNYNHSTFCDLIILGLIGLMPSFNKKNRNKLVISPLITSSVWSYFCLDSIKYHGYYITVLWDAKGEKYHVGKGFKVYVNGILKVSHKKIRTVIIRLDNLERI